MDEVTGWTNLLARVQDVRAALRCLAKDSRSLADRLEDVTSNFTDWDEQEVPASLGPVLQRVLEARTAVLSHMEERDHFAFIQLGTPALDRLVEDILRLCEACLIDCGKVCQGSDFLSSDSSDVAINATQEGN